MIPIENWIALYKAAILETFGSRVLYIGLQGSYARHEAQEGSDIDPVLILDQVTLSDLTLYRAVTDRLPSSELLCGFVSGKEELTGWLKPDLFHFYHDTIDLYGKLSDLLPEILPEDAREAVLTGACALYHACSHNYLHKRESDLGGYLKSACYILKAKYFCETGVYLHSKKEMLPHMTGTDQKILDAILFPESVSLEAGTNLLLNWSSSLIRQYKT